RMLEDYLVQSERTILAAFQRNRTGSQA
ncbi:GntR family transcriptional regulator, partial [Pseudomonas syringae pv. actinidiae]